MTRSELIDYILKHHPALDETMARMLTDCFFDCVSEALTEHQRVELRGFGALSVRERDPRTARNPKTGEEVVLDKKASIYFRPGKQLQELVNDSYEPETV